MGRRGTGAGRRSTSPGEAALWDQVTEVVAPCGCTVHCQMISFMSRARVPQGVTFQRLSRLVCPQPPGRAYPGMRWCGAAGEPASDPGSLDHAGPSRGQICGFAASTSPRVRRERLRLVRLSEARRTPLPDGALPPWRSAQLPPGTAAAPRAHTCTHTGTQTQKNVHARTPRCRHTGTHVHTEMWRPHGQPAAPARGRRGYRPPTRPVPARPPHGAHPPPVPAKSAASEGNVLARNPR